MEFAPQHLKINPVDSEWLHLLVGDWQVIADTSHGDLVLWFPEAPVTADEAEVDIRDVVVDEDTQFRSTSQVRPSTVHTIFHRDMVHQPMGQKIQKRAWLAWNNHEIVRYQDDQTADHLTILTTVIPLVRDGKTVALMTLHTEPYGERTPPRVEVVYRQLAADLISMVSRGVWPEFAAPVGTSRGTPRVSDGILNLDAEGKVLFASPNASSIYKRLGYEGELEGSRLNEITRTLLPTDDKADETLPMVLTGRMPWRAEIQTRRISVTYRSIPLRRLTTLGEERYGAILLCRDVTELRRRELELMTKDATIREIHHRVKNNLQTVSALLRLQSRRMSTDEAKQGLEQAMRRVSTIATVHEALSQGLSQNVDFDELIHRQFRVAAELASPGQEVKTVLEGEFGSLPSLYATPLALVINEIVANAVEHGLDGEAGTVTMRSRRSFNSDGEPILTLEIEDDGKGMGDRTIKESGAGAFRPTSSAEGLGMQIVRTLVASELGGSIKWEPVRPTGTKVTIVAVLAGSKR
ncbi:PAS domain-containing sensor histidine kinase [Rothia sp. LK2588]|uniref:sensor histidine kinase n=1 Tax=Rothia sp. LK2588 TaxID=3114369 RepID=UPI0034CDAD40